MRRQVWANTARGFSLIELLIVVAIILIIAAIAVPNFLRTKVTANQASAVQSLRSINTAEITYSTTYNSGFAPTLAVLGPPATGTAPSVTAADMLDEVLASGQKSGYQFVYTPRASGAVGYEDYAVNANPLVVGATGNSYYYTDSTQVIRVNITSTASSTDSPIPQ